MNEKAISVKQPWAYLLCAGIKDVENRTWPLPEKYKGERMFIHAGMDRRINLSALTKDQYNDACDKLDWNTTTVKPVDRWDRGAIIGSVRFIDCVINHPSIWAERSEPGQDEYTNEWLTPIYNWVAADAILFDEPILNVKGKLSFWDCSNIIHSDLDEDGKPVCLCNLGIDEEYQVRSLGDSFMCKYCDGKWYK